MRHEELVIRIVEMSGDENINWRLYPALRKVVELHKPSAIPDWVPTEIESICWCAHPYPCPTIQAIEKELG
jgi:hypothetical protein